uniref:Putative ovule protein n=1 Tax=Solanum chacoense TaxID=4108 RepID=A0A0V0HKB9_SOLCH
MEQQYQKSSSVDYSLKEGETLKLQIKNKPGGTIRSKFFEQGLNNLSLEEKANRKDSTILLKPPPPPPAPLSPVATDVRSPPVSPSKLSLEQSAETKDSATAKEEPDKSESVKEQGPQDVADDDFGDFQAAG